MDHELEVEVADLPKPLPRAMKAGEWIDISTNREIKYFAKITRIEGDSVFVLRPWLNSERVPNE